MDEVPIRLHIEPVEQGLFCATSPDVPGLVAQGRTVAETIEIAKDVAEKIAETCLEEGYPVPPALRKRRKKSLDVIIPVGAF
jgi:antitoxin HicB